MKSNVNTAIQQTLAYAAIDQIFNQAKTIPAELEIRSISLKSFRDAMSGELGITGRANLGLVVHSTVHQRDLDTFKNSNVRVA